MCGMYYEKHRFFIMLSITRQKFLFSQIDVLPFILQQFYEKLSSKARPKQRSPSRASSHEEDLGQRLEAKLQAAEQKR